MRQLQHAVITGTRRAADLRLLLPLYLTGLLMGLAQAWPAAYAGGAGPLLEALARGETEAMVRLAMAGDVQALASGALAWIALAGLAALVYALAYNLFSGGMLSVMAGRAPYWAGCKRYFLSFTGLGVLLVLLAAIAIGAGIGAGMAGGPIVGVVTALVLLQLVGLLGEYGRAVAVAQDTRNPFAALGSAGRFVGSRLPGVLGLALLGLLLHGIVTAGYSAAGGRAGLFAPVAQQLAALGWLWVKQLRLSWALAYVEGRGGAPGREPALETFTLSSERSS